MKKSSISILTFGLQLLALGLSAQNVGIGTTTPSEKLDVNGNLNITGQLKANGTAGTDGQVLTSNGSTMVWGSIGAQYKNMATFDGTDVANTAGVFNSSYTWTVPTGVTSVLVEGWGGGGGGGLLTSGGGGAYISAQITVTPGSSISLTVGAGGQYGSNGVNGIQGGVTIIDVGSIELRAAGGSGGSVSHDPSEVLLTANYASGYQTGARFYQFGTLPGQAIGFRGGASNVSTLTFVQVGTSEFAQRINYADGGDAALLPGSGGKGGYYLQSTTYAHRMNGQVGRQPGGGGAADNSYGEQGLGGRVIIHY